ncbi:MAG: hypothetical protein CMJ58_22140 [Planctomycetaceae bacterium]|nr:hypothetical protein [Planctomycetaceae bacterium]
MSTESSASDWTAFQQFVAARPQDELAGLTLEEGVEQFRAYQQQLRQLQTKVQVALQQSERGESSELGDEFFTEIDDELQRRGIPD